MITLPAQTPSIRTRVAAEVHSHISLPMLLIMLALIGSWVTGCAVLPAEVSRPVSSALQNNAETRLGKAVAARAAATKTSNESGFALVESAELAFSSRMALIRAADRTLDLQYYAIHADETTDRMFLALREAAARGVRIRILLDDFNTAGVNAQIMKIGFEKNVELRLFNPLASNRSSGMWRIVTSLGQIDRIQRRMHNKLFVADNAVAITGGRNLGDTYFGRGDGVNFVDLDILAAGRIVRDLSSSFDQYWNNPLAYPVQALLSPREVNELKAHVVKPIPADVNALPDTADLTQLGWTWAAAAVLVDKPSKIAEDADTTERSNDTAIDGLISLMAKAKTQLLVVSPYFVPGAEMLQQFANIRQRGVRVRVLTNSLASNDAVAAHAGYARYRKALIAMGVEVYEMRAEQGGTVFSAGRGMGSSGLSAGASRASLHAKSVVVDDLLLVVGSMNLDLRSKLQNSEVAIVIRNRKLAGEATALIEQAITTGAYRVESRGDQLVWRAPAALGLPDTTSEPDASPGLKLLVNIIQPFAPDEML